VRENKLFRKKKGSSLEFGVGGLCLVAIGLGGAVSPHRCLQILVRRHFLVPVHFRRLEGEVWSGLCLIW